MTFDDFIRAADLACQSEGLHAAVVLRLRDADQMRTDHGLRWALRLPDCVEAEIRRVLRPQDLLCRLSDVDFALLLPSLRNRGHVELALNRVQRALEHEMIIDGMIAPVSSTAGICTTGANGDTVEIALHNADRAALLATRADAVPDISAAHPQPGSGSAARPWGDVIARTFRIKG